jgi:hypothetical protein
VAKPRRWPPRFKTRDWVGTGIVTVIAGALVCLAELLPWANDKVSGDLNFAIGRPAGISGAIHTSYGLPVLLMGLVVVALGLIAIIWRPQRVSFVAGLIIMACGLVTVFVCKDAGGSAVAWGFAPGLGLFVGTLVGILLVPIGFTAAVVGFWMPRALAAAGPPEPEPRSG